MMQQPQTIHFCLKIHHKTANLFLLQRNKMPEGKEGERKTGPETAAVKKLHAQRVTHPLGEQGPGN